ncbi:hypothetical protein M422DRAFT_247644 [Sphaerobolus stellatus SS14]|nr:hypothetical protein M422DRAFT_247644 [Sphaerobolus stellatus SS14]
MNGTKIKSGLQIYKISPANTDEICPEILWENHGQEYRQMCDRRANISREFNFFNIGDTVIELSMELTIDGIIGSDPPSGLGLPYEVTGLSVQKKKDYGVPNIQVLERLEISIPE